MFQGHGTLMVSVEAKPEDTYRPGSPIISLTFTCGLPVLIIHKLADLNLLKVPDLLPVRYGLIKRLLLRPVKVGVVLLYTLRQHLARKLALLECVGRVSQGLGNGQQLAFRVIHITCERRGRLDLVPDPFQTRRQPSSQTQVRITVGSRQAALYPEALSRPDNTEGGRPVVFTPGDFGGRPRAGLEPFVAVDGGGVEYHQLRGVLHPSPQEVLELVAAQQSMQSVGQSVLNLCSHFFLSTKMRRTESTHSQACLRLLPNLKEDKGAYLKRALSRAHYFELL
jgi:hypothetical protein